MFVLIHHTQDDNAISLRGTYEDVANARQAMREEYEEAYEDTVTNFLPNYGGAVDDYARNSHCGDMHAWLGFVPDEPEVEWIILDPTHQPIAYLKA